MGLREFRRSMNRSLTEMAEELGVSRTSIKNWQNFYAISYKCRKKFIDVYDIDPLELGIPLEDRGVKPSVCFTGELKRQPIGYRKYTKREKKEEVENDEEDF